MRARLIGIAVVLLVAACAYGPILWNGAGFSMPDDVMAAQLRCCEFRPALGLSYEFNARFGGWMATNLLLHMVAALLVYGLTRSLLAGCLFAAHPMAADAVASVAGRSSILLAIAVFAGVWFAKRHRKLGIAALLLLVGFTAGFRTEFWHQLGGPSEAEHIHRFASAMGSYAVPRMIVPVSLSADPEIHYSMVSEAAGWLTMPLYAPLLPYMAVSLPDVFLEHRAYLCLAWVSFLLAWVLSRRRFAGIVVVAVFAVLSLGRAGVYSSALSLYEDAVAKSPGNARAHVNLAEAYSRLNRYDDVERELLAALHIAPELPAAWKGLAAIRIFKNDPQGALEIFAKKKEILNGM